MKEVLLFYKIEKTDQMSNVIFNINNELYHGAIVEVRYHKV
ncbi:MAG: hypothetical protein RR357_04550 [Clostridia bacterium]